MKARSGFVSNSSSSSFIVGVARVKRKDELIKYLEKEFSGSDDWRKPVVFSTSDIADVINGVSRGYEIEDSINLEKQMIVAESFSGIEFSLPFDLGKEEDFLVINISNDEGDSAFSGSDDWDPQYDISSDFLPLNQQKLFDLEGLGFVENLQIGIGAGRNG